MKIMRKHTKYEYIKFDTDWRHRDQSTRIQKKMYSLFSFLWLQCRECHVLDVQNKNYVLIACLLANDFWITFQEHVGSSLECEIWKNNKSWLRKEKNSDKCIRKYAVKCFWDDVPSDTNDKKTWGNLLG
jgi:hypothetical protein